MMWCYVACENIQKKFSKTCAKGTGDFFLFADMVTLALKVQFLRMDADDKMRMLSMHEA